jgi:hypothetical protein
MAKNRYGWQKRAKEIARKQKNDDKMKRRQNKDTTLAEAEVPEMAEEVMSDPVDPELQPNNPFPHD